MSVPLPGRSLPLGPRAVRALAHRDFRLLWGGQVVSLLGTWMQSTALGWLVLRLTDSPGALGFVGFCSFVPVLAFALPAGVAADRVRRRHALLVLQSVACVNAAVLAWLTFDGRVSLPVIATLAFVQGSVTAFDIPIRQSFLQDLVGRDDLPNAIALNSLAFNGSRLAGPAAAGFVVAAAGEAVCFAINAASFVAVVVALAFVRAGRTHGAAEKTRWSSGIKAGLSYGVRSPLVRPLLLLVVASSLFGMPYTVLMPVFARDVLDVGSKGLGLLMGASGLGATLGALALAARRDHRRPGPKIGVSMAALGLGLIAFGASRSFGVSIALLVVVGGAMITQVTTTNVTLQLSAPPELRGRVISLFMLSFAGMAPFGALLGGALADRYGAPAAVIAGGAACALLGLRHLWSIRSGHDRSRISTS